MESTLIPKSHKSKLPHDLSYPAGAELISAVLFKIQQKTEIRMSFSNSSIYWKSEADKLRKTGTYPVVKAGFAVSENLSMSISYREPGKYDRSPWDLDIYAVPKKHRAIIKSLLIENGLEQIKLWFMAIRPPNWFYGRHECILSYIEKDELLAYKES